MTIYKWVSRAALSLFLGTFLLGANGLVYAQDQQHETKPQQPEPRPDATQPSPEETSPRAGEAKPAEKSADKPAAQEDAKPSGRAEHNSPRSTEPAHSGAKQRRGHIPADKFHAQFGRQHTFAVRQTAVEGQRRFQYSGYWFAVVDPWPVEWADTDEC